MKIKATQKLLSISRIIPIKDLNPNTEKLPGEWFASLVPSGKPGKLAIQFLHCPSYITIIIPGKSLLKALEILPIKVSLYLKRYGFSKLEPDFNLDIVPYIFANDNRKMTGYLNNMKYEIEDHLALIDFSRTSDFERIEDLMFDYLFGSAAHQGKYISTKEALNILLEKKASS